MTLLHMDGFEMGDSAIAGYTGSVATSSSTRLSYGVCGLSGTTAIKRAFPAASQVYTGFAFCTSSPTTAPLVVTLYGDAGATSHLNLTFGTDGSISVKRASTVLASVAAGSMVAGWNYVEITATVSDTVGIVKVRLNGATTDLISFSGDTKNAGTNSTLDAISFNSGGGAGSVAAFDDWYLCDTNGSVNNTWLGDVRIFTLAPNGNGNYSQFVGSDGNSTDNYLLVKEQPYSATDYVGSPTSGNRDSYLMTDLPGTVATVFATREIAVVAKSDAGAATIKQTLRISATDYETAAFTPSTSYASIGNIRETNPNTAAAWTPSGVNGTELGVRVG